MKSILTLFGRIKPESFSRLASHMMSSWVGTPSGREPNPYLLINSRGGSMEASIALHELIKQMPIPVTTVGIGFVDSAATTVFLAGTRRLATSHTRFSFHAGNYSINDAPFADLRMNFDSNLKQFRNLVGIVATATGISVRTAERWLKDGHVCTATEAKKFGIIHEIVSEPLLADVSDFLSCEE